MNEKTVPGTVIPFSEGDGMFSVFRPMIKATGGLTLNQVCSVTGLEGATIQNWVKRGFVAHPVNKKYYERQLARILLICSLRNSMKIESIGELMHLINGNADTESDDIISEEELYDYLCEIIKRIDVNGFYRNEVQQAVDEVTKEYSASRPETAERLKTALKVMAYAYVSGELKQQADSYFTQLKEGKKLK
ncbi:MAG: DUF1836 domain-containing protein [Clostridia bacterium]|nr:DUF1836 domain-containing protein [Clostridia bacterium]